MTCKTAAIYLITYKTGKEKKAHTFSCGKHLGDLVRSSIESALRCKVKVAYCPAPGDQPCLHGT
jgi:hypothetical protein